VGVEFQSTSQWQILDAKGRRKYVTAAERRRVLAVLDGCPPQIRALGYVLAYTGCRISEALELAVHQIEADECRLIFRTLKRRRLIFRGVPVPQSLIEMLLQLPRTHCGRLWTMHRATAYRHVKEAMRAAGIEGPMACCKGFRHGFGIHAASSRVPPNLVTKWMGHASGATTAIYLDAVGWEEREFAGRMW